MSDAGQITPETPPASNMLPQTPTPQSVNLTANLVGTSSLSGSLVVNTPVRIAGITISDFRGFPTGEPYRFGLDNGKNLLLHGENGAGKTSVFHALRLLLSPKKPDKVFVDYQHIFAKRDASTAGVVAIDLTAGSPADYRWDAGNPHPSEDEKDTSFREIARRATFLDYKALLRTSFLHEDKDHINLFDLLVTALLRQAEFPDGRTVGKYWKEVQDFRSKKQLRTARTEKINQFAKGFRDQLNDLLNADKVGIVAKTNEILATLSRSNSTHFKSSAPADQTIAITLEVGEFQVKIWDYKKIAPPNEFSGSDVTLRATYGGKPIPHPAIFFNEARLTAIALALYLATTLVTVPKAKAANYSRLLVLDDALIGLDLSHRLPLLDLLNGDDFKDWQILLLTFDANWFDMASDHLPDDLWVKYRLHAKAHQEGWEIPVLETDAPYLDRAWKHIQNGDFKAAGVYLRTAWENVMRTFCESRHLKIPLKREMREYKAEDFWPLVKNYEFKDARRLVDNRLAGEIEVCRRYVLNPLCHNDPARPTREEVRRAHAAVSLLHSLLEQDTAWRKKVQKGIAPENNFALQLTCHLLKEPNPPLIEIAELLRSAFDYALWNFCERKAFTFSVKCNDALTTQQLWQQSANGLGDLKTTQAAFVTGMENHRDIMLDDVPTRDLLAAKTQADLEQIRNLLCGGVPQAKPKCVLDAW